MTSAAPLLISALVPAAGLSTRMGGALPKPLLPWGSTTIIQTIVTTLHRGGVDEIIVVTGHRQDLLATALAATPARCVFNPVYTNGEMLASIQVGLAAADPAAAGVLLALADQPQIELATVQQVLAAFAASAGTALVIPSYAMRRGHPILLPRRLWPAVLALPAGAALRSVIQHHADEIVYVTVDTPTVLADLDTPEQYRVSRQE
ncbi:MAG: nucleotidyltransferase family protein [Anaerolineae bacterium]